MNRLSGIQIFRAMGTAIYLSIYVCVHVRVNERNLWWAYVVVTLYGIIQQLYTKGGEALMQSCIELHIEYMRMNE